MTLSLCACYSFKGASHLLCGGLDKRCRRAREYKGRHCSWVCLGKLVRDKSAETMSKEVDLVGAASFVVSQSTMEKISSATLPSQVC